MAAQVALRRQQAREENEARELGLLYGCHEGLLAMHRAGFTFSAAMAHMLSGRRGGNEQTTATSSSTAPSTPPPDWKRLSPSDPSPPSAAPSPKRPRLDDDPDDQPSPPDPYDDDERSKDPPSPPPPLPPPPSQEPLDLHHPSSPKKSPVDILARVFPRENRSILNVVLQRNGGDVLQAIDDLLSSKEPPQEAEASSASPRPREPPLPGFLNPHSFFPAAPGPFRRPYASPPSSAAAAAAARGLLAVPAYSGFFPGIAPSFAPGYPNFFGTSSASSTSTTPDECKKKECWNTCGNPSPQDLSSPDTKSPNGYND